MIRAILFDFNGVLLDDEPVHFELFRRVLAEEGLALTEEDYYDDYLGFDDRSGFIFALKLNQRLADASTVARLGARKALYYQDWFREHPYPFFPGALELVRDAAAAGLHLGVVSGALRDEIEDALGQAGILPLVKVVVAAEDVAASKPNSEGYLEGVRRLNGTAPLPQRLLHPHEILAIEDTAAGLVAAGGAGLLTLAVGHTYDAEALHAGGDAHLHGFVEAICGLEIATLQEMFREESRR